MNMPMDRLLQTLPVDVSSAMEEELKCPQCYKHYCNPLLLPCSHSVCKGCAENLQEPTQQFLPTTEDGNPVINETDFADIDKLSVVSETDSGVVCNGSRPNSYVGTPSIGNIYLQSAQGSAFGLKCPRCRKIVFLDENGYLSLPKNTVLETIIEKYGHNKNQVSVKCQLCEENVCDATVMCEQCEIFYCDTCRDSCHPSRGPLAKHNLVDPTQGKAILRAKNKGKEAKCSEHKEEHLSMYCLLCKTTVCVICSQEGRHINHDVQALGMMCKAQKVSM